MLLVAGLLATTLLNAGCQKEGYATDSSIVLDFSVDTVFFDTVLPSMSTTVQVIKIYNNHNKPLLIETVAMKGGSASRFRINVDGDSSRIVRNVELGARDSMFVFVRANINPNDQTTPFLVEDAIVFSFNKKKQELPVAAYGRNAVYHVPDHRVFVGLNASTGDSIFLPYSVIDPTRWNHALPHVVFGYAVVDEGSTLELQAGETLYMADNAYLWVYDGGTLRVKGEAGNPVTFTGLRHDWLYGNLPSQWGYIWLSGGSRDNVIDHAVIENGYAGLRVDTCVNASPTLKISNAIIRNQTLAGIVGQGAWIEGDNLLVTNCGSATLLLQAGGKYVFSSSTFADFWAYGGTNRRKTPSVILTNFHEAGGTVYPRPLSASFRNCIVWGNHFENSEGEELMLNKATGAGWEVDFDHCLLRTQLLDSADFPGKALLVNKDPLFAKTGDSADYHLREKSPALGAGSAALLISNATIDNQPRGVPPAIGCYERAVGR